MGVDFAKAARAAGHAQHPSISDEEPAAQVK
jgi:hypothetical protein